MELLILQWAGALFGVTGSFFVGSQDFRLRHLGFCFFLVSNCFWMAFSLEMQAWGLLAMNLAFTFTSLRGIRANYDAGPKTVDIELPLVKSRTHSAIDPRELAVYTCQCCFCGEHFSDPNKRSVCCKACRTRVVES